MNTYIMDASVVIKWFFDEEFNRQALRYVDDRLTRFAPDFMVLECLGAIQSKVALNKITDQKGWEIFKIIRDYDYIE